MYLNLKTCPCLSKRGELLGLTLSSVSTLDRLWKWLKPAQLLIKTVERESSHSTRVAFYYQFKNVQGTVHTHILMCELGGGTGDFPPQLLVS